MKNTMKLMFGTAAFFAVSTLFAQGVYSKASDFVKNPAIKDGNETVVANAKTEMTAMDMFTIDPDKTYIANFDARAHGLKAAEGSYILAGFKIFDKQNREIYSLHAATVNDSDTLLAADAQKGDISILVNDASKWKPRSNYVMLYNTKPDKSDLPNRNLISDGGVRKIEKDGSNWKITFSQPIKFSLKAGIPVRAHISGRNLYTVKSRHIKDSWVNFTGTIKGVAQPGEWTYSKWPSCAVKARLFILSNWNNKAESVEYKNVSVKTE